MKVLNLIQCVNLGGMERASYTLMESSSQQVQWRVQSVTPAGEGKRVLSNASIPFEENLYSGKFGYKTHSLLKQRVSDYSGDIILVTGPTLSSCMAVKSSKCRKILGIHFCHGRSWKEQTKWKIFYKVFGKDYDAIIFYSQYVLDEALKIAPQLTSKFHLIDYSTKRVKATSKEEKDRARERLDIPKSAFVIGNAGWLIERKRFDIFLRVSAKVISQNKSAYCLIAGDGSLRPTLEALASDLQIRERVRFLGWQENLDPFYKSIDILLFNSNSDAFGRTVMEAMGYGCPTVASVLEGGPRSILVHEKTGFLIDNHSTDQLCQYCLNLSSNPNLYETMRLAGVDAVSKRCSEFSYIDSHLKIFKETLGLSSKNEAVR